MRSAHRPAPRDTRSVPAASTYVQLEARTLLASFSWNNPWIEALATQLVSQLSSPPSIVQSPAVVGSSVVTGKTAKLSVLAADDGGESALRYFWQAHSVPSNGSVQFSSNGSNSSKNTTLTFGAAGTYQLSVRAIDRLGLATTSLLTVQVNPVATSISIRNGNNIAVTSGSVNSLTGATSSYSAVVLDQFGRPLSTQPSLTWSIVTRPLGASPQLTTSGNSTSLQFDRIGDYLLRATGNGLTGQFTVRVAPVLSRLALLKTDGTAVSSGSTLAVAGTNASLRMQGFDQFGVALTKLDGVSWSATSRPSGANLAIANGNGGTNFTFTRAGNYAVRCASPAGNIDLQFNVSQQLTAIRVASGARSFLSGTTSVLPLNQANFAATAVDQFGVPLTNQPEFAWSLTGQPSGANTSTRFESNLAQLSFNQNGLYSLRVSSGTASTQFQLNVVPALTTLQAARQDGTAIASGATTAVTANSFTLRLRGFDQFGAALTPLPQLTWTTLAAPLGGKATVSSSGELATFNFTRAGTYSLKASQGGELYQLNFDVQSVFTSVQLTSSTAKPIASGSRIASTGTPVSVAARALDQFGMPLSTQPAISWSASQTPTGAAPTLQTTGNSLTISFDRAGNYTLVASANSSQASVIVEIAQRQTALALTPGSATVVAGASLNFSARLTDQFGQAMATQPAFTWTSTGGTISTSGSYTAGTTAGSFSVTARTGTWSRTANVSVTASTPVDGFFNSDIRELVTSAYADGTVDRSEMMTILRSAGDGGSVTASELADLRFLITPSSLYNMPEHVRNLAGDVLNGNQANATYQRQSLGNLASGSTETHLNKLVDKWFLGTDLPILTSTSLQYRPAAGNLFNSTPSLNDARQGMLGDCYLIASLTSIAARNPTAIQNMFIDNGDDTFTIRFFGGNYGSFYDSSGLISSGFSSGLGTSDYVTVNRQLATQSDGSFAYSNYGLASSSSVPLWIALAEKGYAQWNQTGLAGRDGTLNFSAIEGGWMSDVNAQVLGYNSTLYYFQSSSSQSLINALSGGQAVTLGTRSSTGIASLVGGHAYTVSSYSAGTGKFTLHNPWGTSHPIPLTWSQLVGSCTAFVTVNPQGSSVASAPAWSVNGFQWAGTAAGDNSPGLAAAVTSQTSNDQRQATSGETATESRLAENSPQMVSALASQPEPEQDPSQTELPGESSTGSERETWAALDQIFALLTTEPLSFGFAASLEFTR